MIAALSRNASPGIATHAAGSDRAAHRTGARPNRRRGEDGTVPGLTGTASLG